MTASPSVDQCADLTGVIDHETIIALAQTIHTLMLIGNAPPIVKRIYAWCKAPPQPGDLVVELSSRKVQADRVGLFERYEERRVCSHERADVNHPGCTDPDCLEYRTEIGGEHFTWILVQRHPRRNCRWHNASFLRQPKNRAQQTAAEGRDVPASLDRPTLVGILADSGILLKSAP